jgi:hypothetical protein
MGMTIGRNEGWVQIAELDEDDQIHFTAAFRKLMNDLDWEAKAFVGHLLGLWYDPFEHMLDYTSSEARHSEDQPGQFNRNGLDEPQEVVEYWAEQWSKNDQNHQPPHEAGTGLELDTAWYRDILRAKLVSMHIPKRLLLAYRDQVLAVIRRLESSME